MISEDILEKVGEEDENPEDIDCLDESDPKIEKVNDPEDLNSLQNFETEEDILKKKIESAVK